MSDNKIKFVVIAQARSGSTLLRKSLHSHSDIICHGEVLSRKWINGLVPKINPIQERSPKTEILKLLNFRDGNLIEFLDNYIYNFPSKAVGFKLIYEDLFLSDWKEQFVDYVAENEIQVFHLVRLNPLSALISRKRMALYGISHSDSPKNTSNRDDKILIKPIEIQKYIAQQSLYRNQVDLLFRTSGTIIYEDISAGYKRMLEKLDLNIIRMEKKLHKLNNKPLKEYVLNYEDIQQYDLSSFE